jgi:hypothetical protein
MHNADTTPTAAQPRSARPECCTEHQCESGLRNNYYEGKRLTTDSFRVEQRYLLERRRLLNRAIHGWGVVYGYPVGRLEHSPVGSAPGPLAIGSGLALDPCGRELLQVGSPELRPEELLVLDGKGGRTDPAQAFSAANLPRSTARCWLLRVHYAEQSVARVSVNGACRCEHEEWDRTCETVRYSLQSVACTECCDPGDCELNCECGSGPCCGDAVSRKSLVTRREGSGALRRGGCRCL